MKKDYQIPKSRIVLFRTTDVIMASTTEEDEDETEIVRFDLDGGSSSSSSSELVS